TSTSPSNAAKHRESPVTGNSGDRQGRNVSWMMFSTAASEGERMFQSVLEALRYPIWQAPTGSIAGPELAAAVSKAGGMGAMGLTWTIPEVAAEQVSQVRNLTENPCQFTPGRGSRGHADRGP